MQSCAYNDIRIKIKSNPSKPKRLMNENTISLVVLVIVWSNLDQHVHSFSSSWDPILGNKAPSFT